MNKLFDELLPLLKDPALIEMLAGLASLIPGKEAQVAAAVLRLAAAFVRSGVKAEELDAILARYSAEAQQIAFDWV